MRVDIWSDVICPWCYIGKRRFERALARFDGEVEVVWRSYELAPGAPREREGDMAGHLARKYGMSVELADRAMANITDQAAELGLEYRLDIARAGNTFDAHRLLHLARDRGVQDALQERLFAAYLTEGVAIGARQNLAMLAGAVGIAEDDARAVLESDAYADAVRADEEEARQRDILAVPTFVFDGRATVPGAQDPDTFLKVLRRVAS